MYKVINENTIQRTSDGLYIPRDESNQDYLDFVEWESSGGVVSPVDPVPLYVPQEVPIAQWYAALMQLGLYEEMNNWTNGPDTDPLHKLALVRGSQLRRDSPALEALSLYYGWTSAALDNQFIAADSIRL